MSRAKVSQDDLAAAIDWLHTYDDTDIGGETTAAMQRVADMLEAEIEKRQEDALMREYGIRRESAREVRATLREDGKL